jgi:ParB-like chromosome segregation protein Spo0J
VAPSNPSTGPREAAPPPPRLTPIGELLEHPFNAREGDVGAILSSIDRNGFFGVILAQVSTGYIVAGNHRYQAAVLAGLTALPVQWLELTDTGALQILLADNRTADRGNNDQAALAVLLTELAQAGDLDGTGYQADDLDELLAELERPALPDLAARAGGQDGDQDDAAPGGDGPGASPPDERPLYHCARCALNFQA